jgi:hypothetical protein
VSLRQIFIVLPSGLALQTVTPETVSRKCTAAGEGRTGSYVDSTSSGLRHLTLTQPRNPAKSAYLFMFSRCGSKIRTNCPAHTDLASQWCGTHVADRLSGTTRSAHGRSLPMRS